MRLTGEGGDGSVEDRSEAADRCGWATLDWEPCAHSVPAHACSATTHMDPADGLNHFLSVTVLVFSVHLLCQNVL